MRKNVFFILRALCFALVVALLWSYATYVLTPKSDYGICPMLTWYRQAPDTVDVLTIGTSLAYAGINTNVLYHDYGIAAYNLCSAEQPYWISLYYLREALRVTRPRLLLIDAKSAVYTQDYSHRGRAILSTYGMLSPDTRFAALDAALSPEMDRVSYMLGLTEMHENYRRVQPEDFAFPPTNGGRGPDWKGFIEARAMETHVQPTITWDTTHALNPREEHYLRQLLDLAQAEGLPVRFVAIPNPDYANDRPYYKALWLIAEEYGIPWTDYNTPGSVAHLDYYYHFADWQHLNVDGSVYFSRQLGLDLDAQYQLPDHRGDPSWDSWQRETQRWYQEFSSGA